MMLNEVSATWGHSTVVESDPADEVVRDAIYVPFRPDVFFDHDPKWGLYGKDGRLISAGAYITRLRGEEIIEARMAQAGAEIVHPQDLSLKDQIRLFARAKTVVGTVGSAFHTILFVRTPPRVIGLTGTNLVNANYSLIDNVKATKPLYVYPEISATAIRDEGGFASTWIIEDMETVAQQLTSYI